jgi:predicted nucleotidyltransferase
VLALDVDLERLREVCERYGVVSLEVFGSVARGDNRPDSDLDLLYVLRPGARLAFKLFDLEDEFAALFGRPALLVGVEGGGVPGLDEHGCSSWCYRAGP